MRIAALIFFAVPLIEMLILIEVGSMIGALPTVGLVIMTAVVGVWLLRLEGLATLARVQQKLDQGQLPETELLEGVMLIIGGALLLTPGFATDALGFICLIPGFRRPLASRIIRSASFSTFSSVGGSFRTYQHHQGDSGFRNDGQTIDGEYREESDTSPGGIDSNRIERPHD